MNKKIVTRFLSYVAVAAAASLLTLTLAVPRSSYSKLDQLEALILERFIGEADTAAMENAAAYAMVNALGDRWSYYMSASEYAAYQERVNNSYVGIGVTITQQEDPAGLLVITVDAGGSASEAGILPGDLIIGVNGEPVEGKTAAETRDIVRGKEGTTLTIQILRDGAELDFTLTRKQVETPVATGTMLENDIGLVSIVNFDSRCAQESIAAIEALLDQGAKALIFDVRNNPGGYASELVKLLDYLLPEGNLFSTVDYLGNEHTDTSGPEHLDIPFAVLCNENSYSAAEFFAAAIQEYEAGVIIGMPTCGKGYFQNTFRLADGSAVGLSVGKYFTPKGNSLIGVGIQPDVLIDVDDATFSGIYYGTLSPQEDPQLQAAVRALR